MATLKDKIDMTRIPQHVAVIMDGNGRWAKQHGKERLFGQKQIGRSISTVRFDFNPPLAQRRRFAII